MNGFLPVTKKKDMLERGWEQADFVYVCGDAYVDHPSFGAAIITRVLENAGFKSHSLLSPTGAAIRISPASADRGSASLSAAAISTRWSLTIPSPRSAARRTLTDPGGKVGLRPDRAVIVYCNKIREIYGDIPIIIGGLEASLRRFAHYDYWDDKVRRSILFDSQADLLSFGMGERSMVEIATRLDDGEDISQMHDIRGTCYSVDVRETPYVGVECPSFENVCNSKKEYAVSSEFSRMSRISSAVR